MGTESTPSQPENARATKKPAEPGHAGGSSSSTHVGHAATSQSGGQVLAASPALAAQLQRAAGNRATLHWLGAQAKLEVGSVDDPLEREAETTARLVVDALNSNEPAVDEPSSIVARRVQRKAEIGAEGGDVDPDTEREVNAARGRGAPMPAPIRRSMEGAFDADFSDVRLHAGANATRLNDRVQAKAFTIGSDIFFRGGMPDGQSRGGQELLAHELTHVVQQGGTAQRSPRIRRLKNPFKNFFGKKKKKKPDPAISGPSEVKSTSAAGLVAMVRSADAATRAFMAKDPRFLQKVESLLDGTEKIEVLGLLQAALKPEASDVGEAEDAPVDGVAQAKAEAEAEATAVAEAKALADAKAQAEAEEQARVEAEAQAQTQATAKAEAEAQVQAAAQAQAQAEADALALAKAQADAKAKAESEAEAKRIAEEDKKYQTTAEIQALALPDLMAYIAKTPLWHKRSTITIDENALITQVHTFALEPGVASILDAFTIANLVALTSGPLAGTIGDVMSDLRAYVQAASANEPISLKLDPNLASARSKGNALSKMLADFPAWVLRTALDERSFVLMLKAGYIDDVIAYYKSTPTPTFQAASGADFIAYYNFRKSDNKDPASYQTALGAYMRNFHRFEAAALDKVAKNYANGNSKSRPLTIVLHAAVDHNGAFHRDNLLTAVVRNPNIFTLIVEGGVTLAEYQSQIGPLAQAYGVNQKIDQVMFAGHGNSRIIEMAGGVKESSKGTLEETGQPIDLVGDKAAADALFDEVLANMDDAAAAALRDPTAVSFRRVLFNACLTNSNTVDIALTGDKVAAKAEILDYIAKNASLATYLGNRAKASGHDVTSLGANASIGQVDLVEGATGKLDMVSAVDPFVTASKLEYAEHGIEPAGVLRAALEAWAGDEAATLEAMARRAAKGSTKWDDVIIETIYGSVLFNKDNAAVATQMKTWEQLAASLSEMKSDGHCKPAELFSLMGGSIHRTYFSTLFAKLQNADEYKKTPALELVILQLWLWCLPTDTSIQNRFLTVLETKFDAKSAVVADGKYVNVKYLKDIAVLPTLLTDPVSKGKTVFALICLLDKAAPTEAKEYLKRQLLPEVPEVAELPEVPAVPEVPEQDAPRPLVPLVPKVAGRPKVDAIPGRRTAVAAVPDLAELPELAEVNATSGPKTKEGAGPEAGKAPGRAGRAKRDAVAKVDKVKPYLPDTLDVKKLVAKRATEDELIAKLS
ncbi:MAG: hypothetical protein QOI95_2569 [Acidimicrobiaceae bacterium]|jgi:hypothetical protein